MALEQLRERCKKAVQLHQKAININQIFALTGLRYLAVRATLIQVPVRTEAKLREAANSFIMTSEIDPGRVKYVARYSSGRSNKNA